MRPPRYRKALTVRSMAAAQALCEMRDTIRAGLVRASGGKSHSWLTPAILSPRPSANRISVAEGSKEQIFMPCNLPPLAWPRFILTAQSRYGHLLASFPGLFFIGSTLSCVTLQPFAGNFLPTVLLRGNPMRKLDRYVLAVFGAAAIVCAASAFGEQQAQGPKTYTLKPTPKTIAWGYYDANTPPALRVQSGDTVEVQTLPAGRTPAVLEAAGLPPEQVEQSFRDIFKEVATKGPGDHS